MAIEFDEAVSRLQSGEEIKVEHILKNYTEYSFDGTEDVVPLAVVHRLIQENVVWEIKISHKLGRLVFRQEGDIDSPRVFRLLTEKSDYVGLIVYNALHFELKSILSKDDVQLFKDTVSLFMRTLQTEPALVPIVASIRELRKRAIPTAKKRGRKPKEPDEEGEGRQTSL